MYKWLLGGMVFLVLIVGDWAIAHGEGKQIVGRIEKVMITHQKIPMDAKLDTGADMSSLSAQQIELFQFHHQTWVRFQLKVSRSAKTYTLTAPLEHMTRILKRKDEQQNTKYGQRPVIRLEICLGGVRDTILVNLVDRSDFYYPMLLGVTTLKKLNVLVDVSQDHLTALKKCHGSEKKEFIR